MTYHKNVERINTETQLDVHIYELGKNILGQGGNSFETT